MKYFLFLAIFWMHSPSAAADRFETKCPKFVADESTLPQKDLKALKALGYTESVIQFMQQRRPELVAFLLSTKKNYPMNELVKDAIAADDFHSPVPQNIVVKGRQAVRLYRGIPINLEKFNPHFAANHVGATQNKTYVTEMMAAALIFATSQSRTKKSGTGILVEYVVPRFFLKTLAANEQTVDARLFDDQCVFINRVAEVPLGGNIDKLAAGLKSDESKWLLDWQDRAGTNVKTVAPVK